METNSGARIGALSDRTHEIFARHWFHYLAHTFRHELKIDGPVFRLYTAMRLETGFDEVVDVVRDEGNKLREHIDQAVARLHAMPGGVVSRTWVSEQGLTIGRSPRNVLVIPDDIVS